METEAEWIVRLLVDGHVYRAMLAAKEWVAGHPVQRPAEPVPDDDECGLVNRE